MATEIETKKYAISNDTSLNGVHVYVNFEKNKISISFNQEKYELKLNELKNNEVGIHIFQKEKI